MSDSRRAGFAIVLVATLLWSTAGLFVHMAALDVWSVIVWRSLFASATLGLSWLFVTKRRIEALRATCSWPGLGGVLITVVSGISYVTSLELTSVANVMTVYAALPFIASAIAFFAFGECASLRFVACGLAAAVGIAVMSSAALTANDVLGIVAALVMTAGFASALVQAKKYPSLDMTLVTVAAALVSGAVALPMTGTPAPAPHQLLACAMLGILTTGMANVLSLMGARLIRSGEAGLLSLLDVPLGPLWVWLAFNERVGAPALLGGGIVLLAVIMYLLRPGKDDGIGTAIEEPACRPYRANGALFRQPGILSSDGIDIVDKARSPIARRLATVTRAAYLRPANQTRDTDEPAPP